MSSEAVVEAHAVESTIALAAHEAVGRVNLPLLRDVIDIDIDYILVVGHFGLATGSGGITQSNVHTTSRVHQINNVHAPLPKSWSTQTRLEPYPSSSAQ